MHTHKICRRLYVYFVVCLHSFIALNGVLAADAVTMPTVLLLDVSLSMNRPLPGAVVSSPVADVNTYCHLAVRGINSMLDYLAANNKLEFVSLVCQPDLHSTIYNTYSHSLLCFVTF